MTTTLENRAYAIAESALSEHVAKRTKHGAALQEEILRNLRAVEQAATKAAYERAKEEVHKELGPNMNHYWNSAIAVAVSNIRALADGGSDG